MARRMTMLPSLITWSNFARPSMCNIHNTWVENDAIVYDWWLEPYSRNVTSCILAELDTAINLRVRIFYNAMH